jgi:glycosyltransferase involved in cell wall biosynthesis
LRKKKYSVVQTSTSLDGSSVIRDCFYIIISSWFKIDVIVFYRGWKKDFQNRLEHTFILSFKKVFFKAAASIVLSNEIKEKLLEWGYKKPIYVETTLVDSNLIKKFDTAVSRNKYSNIEEPKLLFLSRIEIAKGIYETIDTFLLLQKKYKTIKLTIAGDGLETKNVLKYLKKNNVSNVTVKGFIEGNDKINEFLSSHIFILPSYTEGMPGTVCEAMAFGLPVITRRVGGLIDFFKEGEHGFITDSKEPKVFYEFADKLLSNPALMEKISCANHKYAVERFSSANVAARIEQIFTNFEKEN